MKKINSRDLAEVLRLHKLWLEGKTGGLKANLTGANLEGANLEEADLSRANLMMTNLRSVDLRGANLRGTNLAGANLTDAALERANLSEADLRWVNLTDAALTGANLTAADLRGAYLSGAYLSGADLSGTILDTTTDPSKGSAAEPAKETTMIIEDSPPQQRPLETLPLVVGVPVLIINTGSLAIVDSVEDAAMDTYKVTTQGGHTGTFDSTELVVLMENTIDKLKCSEFKTKCLNHYLLPRDKLGIRLNKLCQTLAVQGKEAGKLLHNIDDLTDDAVARIMERLDTIESIEWL